MSVLDEVQSELSIDPDRVYLTGGSGGGNGVWVIGTRYPERFAALEPDSQAFACESGFLYP